ncbi:MAG: beta-ketoacyl-ACP synthase III [Patiriisocius sp.]|uniref:beta-ketoacyl-ACP synthase III n=1 Tax=Patiriisocius sp. TaxID=2822396 RepID=UPI003EF527E8
MRDVYITRTSKFLPNSPVTNDEMEELLGEVNGKESRARRIVLRNNQIKTRYYAIDKDGNPTHTNAQIAKEAIEGLLDKDFTKNDIELLSFGTGSADQTLPSHAAMVHGELKGSNMEINSPTGACCSGMNALKYGYMAIKSGEYDNAVCGASERVSGWLKGGIYEDEVVHLSTLEEKPILAFNKDFLRWMLSDGAGAFLLQPKPLGETNLKIEWMDGFSFANELETCMYSGSDKNEDGSLTSWNDIPVTDWGKKSVFALKQDTRILGENVLVKGVEGMVRSMKKHNVSIDDIDYFLPHISSYFFKDRLYEELKKRDVEVPWDKWFMNLSEVGNVGAVSIFLMIDGLIASGKLKKGDKIWLIVPESARFSYFNALLTVC